MKSLWNMLIILPLLLLVSCSYPFDMDMDDEPVIFLESFPGADDVIAFDIRPAYSLSNSAAYQEFVPQIHLTINGKEVQVVLNKDNCVSDNHPQTSYIAQYSPSEGDELVVEVSSEGFRKIYAETVIPRSFPERKIDYRQDTFGDREANVLYLSPDNDPQSYFAYGFQILHEDVWLYDGKNEVSSRKYAARQLSDDYDMAPGSVQGMIVDFNGDDMNVWKAGESKGYADTFPLLISYKGYEWEDPYDAFFVNADENGISRNRLLLYTMSEEFYRYLVAQKLVEDNAGFFAGLAPSNFCYTNVKGGYGAFAGVNCSQTEWITPEFIENNR